MTTFEAKRKIHTVATLAEELVSLVEAGLGERYVLMPTPVEFGPNYDGDYVFISRRVATRDLKQKCVYLQDIGFEDDKEFGELLLPQEVWEVSP